MAVGSGLVAQLGVATETTAGTRAVPTRFFEFTAESIQHTISWINSAGLRAGRRTLRRYGRGQEEVTGGFDMELAAQGIGILLEHAIGDVASTSVGSYYQHTFTPGDLSTMTVQVGRPSIDGTVRPFDYAGCSVTGWNLGAQTGQYATAHFDIYGMTETTALSTASASYPSDLDPFTFVDGSVTIDSTATCVKSFTFTADNALATGRFQICGTNSGLPKRAVEQGFRTYSGQLVADFADLTQYTKFVNGTEAALKLEFAVGTTASLTIESNIRFDGQTPTVGGAELLEQQLPFTCVSGSSDSDTVTVTLINGDSTP